MVSMEADGDKLEFVISIVFDFLFSIFSDGKVTGALWVSMTSKKKISDLCKYW